MKDDRNCKEYCRYAQYCYTKGAVGMDPEDCAMFFKIDDLLMDARYSRDDYDPDEEYEEKEEEE